MFDFHLGRKIGASRLRRDHMEGSRRPSRAPRLDRRNAIKNIDYEAGVVASESTSWASSSSASAAGAGGGGLRASRSLDLPPADYSNKTSFRIGGGVEGEVDLLCRSLGLSGPEDFAIPVAAWEARKALSSSSLLPRSRLLDSPAPSPSAVTSPPLDPSPPELDLQVREDRSPSDQPKLEIRARSDSPRADLRSPASAGRGDGGIRGSRPPVLSPPPPKISALAPPPSRSTLAPPPSRSTLAPPPLMSRPVLDKIGSAWDIVMSLAPDGGEDGGLGGSRRRSFDSDDDDHGYNGEAEEEKVPRGNAEREELWLAVTAGDISRSCSFSTSNDEDDSSSTTTEAMFISPNDRFRRSIRSWMRGKLLGSGSFGTVYEAISDDGFFFAVKEVLLDDGNNAKQCIFQLEQEIALLSQFEHENIVQYYGTAKEETKLFIFLEFVTQGSLASLYQKYHLRDSQVSAYTRQILSGLKYLHDRNVVHRDIKCANILVHANGSVKLADFGLAKEITKFNELKSSKGSVYWMAPEVVNPKRTYGPAADIWSLGCTVLEMLTRQIPYPDLEWTQALFKIGRGEKPPIPNSLSKDARDFISQCVRVNPDDRPSAAKLLEHPFVRRSLAASEFSDSSSHGNGR